MAPPTPHQATGQSTKSGRDQQRSVLKPLQPYGHQSIQKQPSTLLKPVGPNRPAGTSLLRNPTVKPKQIQQKWDPAEALINSCKKRKKDELKLPEVDPSRPPVEIEVDVGEEAPPPRSSKRIRDAQEDQEDILLQDVEDWMKVTFCR